MYAPGRGYRAYVAAITLAVLTAMSVAVPLLDQGLPEGGSRLSAPGTAAGYVDHHHGVCLQHSAAAWSAAEGADLPSELLVREAEPLRGTVHPSGRSSWSTYHSRAPPIV
jgi:hypothetical protein